MDIKKNAESIADLLVSFFEQFLYLLINPKVTIQKLFSAQTTSRGRLRVAIVFSISSILVGIAFARFVGLSGSPTAVSPEAAIGVLLVWVFSALILHPLLKLFKTKGLLQDTIVVFLIVISSLHLVFIPIISVASHLLTDTKVTLTYDYVVYFGINDDSRKGKLRGDVGRLLEKSFDWQSRYKGRKTETYIKENDRKKDVTVLPPASELKSYKDSSEIPTSTDGIKRVDANNNLYDKPKRTEEPVLASGVSTILIGILLGYYLINAGYLSVGLSVPHKKNQYFLFSLAVFGPIILIVLGALLFLGYIYMF